MIIKQGMSISRLTMDRSEFQDLVGGGWLAQWELCHCLVSQFRVSTPAWRWLVAPVGFFPAAGGPVVTGTIFTVSSSNGQTFVV